MKAITRFTSILFLSMLLVSLTMNMGYADKPKKGGELTGATGQFPRHFNTAVQSGLATAVPSAQIFASLLDFDENWQPVPYLAKSWEASDGGMRFSATLDWLPGVPDDQQMVAEYLKPQFKKVGIDIVLRPPPDFGTWLKRVAGWDYDLTLNLPFCYPDPIIGVHRLYLSTNIKHIPWSNTQGYSNPKADDILNKAAVEIDFEKRKALYVEFQKIVTDELPLIYIHEIAAFTFLHKDLMGWPKGIWGSNGTRPWNLLERWAYT